MANYDKFLVNLNTAGIVYGPDFVKAVQGSFAKLGNTMLLVPKMLDRIASIGLPIDCPLNRMKKLAKLVYLSVFAESPNDQLVNDTLIDYFYNNKHYSWQIMQFFSVTLKIKTRIDKDAIEKSTLSI